MRLGDGVGDDAAVVTATDVLGVDDADGTERPEAVCPPHAVRMSTADTRTTNTARSAIRRDTQPSLTATGR
jgi:hypothetical protein